MKNKLDFNILKSLFSSFSKKEISLYWLNNDDPMESSISILKQFMQKAIINLDKTSIASMVEFIGRIKLIEDHGPIVTSKQAYSSTHGVEAIAVEAGKNLVVYEAKSTNIVFLEENAVKSGRRISMINGIDKVHEAERGLKATPSITTGGTIDNLKVSITRKNLAGISISAGDQSSLLNDLENINKGNPNSAVIAFSYNGLDLSTSFKGAFINQDNVGMKLSIKEYIDLYKILERKI